MIEAINSNISNLISMRENDVILKKIEDVITLLSMTLKMNLPVLVCGNGGSASDALHISGELVGRFNIDRKPFNVICLNSNVTVITAWANDVDFESVFSRQVEAHGTPRGVLWGLSTTGNSKNIVEAFKIARRIGMKTIAFTGLGGGTLCNFSDILIDVPSTKTPQIQELHTIIYHYVCAQVEIKVNNK